MHLANTILSIFLAIVLIAISLVTNVIHIIGLTTIAILLVALIAFNREAIKIDAKRKAKYSKKW